MLRRLRWLIAGVALLATLMTTVFAVPALRAYAVGAFEQPSDYLALGDSVAFGFNPLLDKTNAANFIGYPDVVASDLKENLTNASCPGEASGGFISLSSPDDNGCRAYRFFLHLPLHVDYSTAQLDFAVGFLQSHHDTRLVTIDIGANDLFVLQKSCAGSVTCIESGLPGMLNTLASNLSAIFSAIRGTGYTGELVTLTYYALNYSDPTGVAIISAVNNTVAQVTLNFGGTIADGFNSFQKIAVEFNGDSCAAGLLIVKPDGTCDIHPSKLGRNVLAHAILHVARHDS